MGKITLITGGVRSGKSSFALEKGGLTRDENKFFIATAEALDDEMRERAKNHQKERGAAWRTIEEPCKLADAVAHLPGRSTAVIDCLTVWLGNVWYKIGNDYKTLEKYIDDLFDAFDSWKTGREGHVFIVSNEVGWGIVPHAPAVRRYRDQAGRLNQKIAEIADDVFLSVAGIEIKIK